MGVRFLRAVPLGRSRSLSTTQRIGLRICRLTHGQGGGGQTYDRPCARVRQTNPLLWCNRTYAHTRKLTW